MRVIHVGPDPNEVGGISSVISSLCELKLTDIEVDYLVSWKPNHFGGILKLKNVLRSFFQNVRDRENILYHIHFGNKGSYIREGAIFLIAKFLKYRTMITFHGSKLHGRRNPRFFELNLSFFPRLADATVCLSPETRGLLEKNAKVLYLVANPIPKQILEMNRNNSSGVDLILFAGTRDFRKGFDVFLRVSESLSQIRSDLKFAVVGPKGDCNFSLPSSVHDFGSLQRGEFLKLLSKAKVLCLPTKAEQSSMVIWEAIALNVVVVTTPIPSNVNILGTDYPFYAKDEYLENALLKALNSDHSFLDLLRPKILEPAQFEYQSTLWTRIYMLIFNTSP